MQFLLLNLWEYYGFKKIVFLLFYLLSFVFLKIGFALPSDYV